MRQLAVVVVCCLSGGSVALCTQVFPLESLSGWPEPPRRFSSPSREVTTQWGTSYQVNVDPLGKNIVGDAANEPSLCIDPNHPSRIAVGWRQFNTITNSFRQAGFGWSTNGGLNWGFGGVLETNVFRSDPVLATDADGGFYYLSLTPFPVFACDLWKSTNGGKAWTRIGPALGGDKSWMTIDATTNTTKGTVYECWSVVANEYSTNIISSSPYLGQTWHSPSPIPQSPFWSTVDVGPNGELYHFGWNGEGFWLSRSTDPGQNPQGLDFDVSIPVELGGDIVTGSPINPEGLMGQPWVAVDRSVGPYRGRVYTLCSVSRNGNPTDVMFARSLDGGETWDPPVRLNDDPVERKAYHWFGTLSVSPSGRVDACWYDTRNSQLNHTSELYYAYSLDGGATWAANRAVSPPFDPALGYPIQQKIGDYIGMISRLDGACIAYAATFNGEEDIWFLRIQQPLVVRIERASTGVELSWDAVVGRTYCIQSIPDLQTSWTNATSWGCLPATNLVMRVNLPISIGAEFLRVIRD